ncbi:MAG: cation:proton antiporter [Gemmatimonadota bacterium]|nr:cation:proton antiporter [Gemmatimonadota bacterium]
MHNDTAFLQTLALVLCVAAITTVLFQRLRQPVVFGYLLAGMILGPHISVPLSADQEIVRTLSELGVILLMFSLGLEFSLHRVIQVGTTSGLAALAETSAMLGLGYLLGRTFGWTSIESLFAGAIVAISSTTIITKAFAEQGVKGRFTDVVFGILIFEDLIAILLVALLTAVASGGGLSAGGLALTVIRLATFLAGLVIVGLMVVPRFLRLVARVDRAETTLVASLGICFAAALLALTFGYSVALGAFIAGSLVAESGHEKAVEQVVLPVRDMFVAIFFVSVGMLIDPRVIVAHWGAVLAFTAVVMLGKVITVTAATFLTGAGLRSAVQTGMSLAQVGEFSFIIAAVGLSFGATRSFLYPVAVAVSAITTLTTPWLIRAAPPVTLYLDRKLPKPVQNFAALYGSWLERLRTSPNDAGGRSRVRRIVRIVLLDAVLLVALVVGAAAEMGRITPLLVQWTSATERVAGIGVIVIAVVLAIPLLIGLVRSAHQLGYALALRALPKAIIGRVDFAAAPRETLIVTVQLSIIFVVIVPLVAITQPFVSALPGAAFLLLLAIALGVAFWRSARDLHGHARAGAEAIVAALAAQMATSVEPEALRHTMEHMHVVLPGLGEPEPLHVSASSPAANRSLAELNLRGITGATVLAIIRAGERVIVPSGHDRIEPGDVLAVAGTQEAIAAARELVEVVTL